MEFKCRKSDAEKEAAIEKRVKHYWERMRSEHFAYLPVSRNDGSGKCFWWVKYKLKYDPRLDVYATFKEECLKFWKVHFLCEDLGDAAAQFYIKTYDSSERYPVE